MQYPYGLQKGGMPSTEGLQKGPSRMRLKKGLSVVFLNWKTSNNKLAEEQNEYKFKLEKSLYVKCVERNLWL